MKFLKELLKLILLNKAYYHLISGYASLAKKVRGSLSSIAHFDIAVELKLNAIISSTVYKPFRDPELVREALIKLIGLDEKLVKTFQKYVSDFKETRAKAIHFGYLTLSSLSNLIIRNLTDFMLYEINRSYLNEEFIELLNELFNRNKIILDNSSLKIPLKLRQELLRVGLIISIDKPASIEIGEGLLSFFAILDDNNDFKRKILEHEIITLISPLLYLCSPRIRLRFEAFNAYVKSFWGKYSRFKTRAIVMSNMKPENVFEYIDGLVSYAKRLAKISVQKPSSFLDFLYSGITRELRSILIKYERLRKEKMIDREIVQKILETLREKLEPKQSEMNLLYREFFKMREDRICVTYASMLSEPALLHLLKVVKEIFPHKAPEINRAFKNTLIAHINQISDVPTLLREE